MEEIDIIELLQRVKEGKAPKRIEIEGVIYERNTDEQFRDCVDFMYQHYRGVDEPIDWWIDDKDITLDTKIKILDKPIIEELEISTDGKSPILIKKDGKTNNLRTIDVEIINKLNEIIKKMNNKE